MIYISKLFQYPKLCIAMVSEVMMEAMDMTNNLSEAHLVLKRKREREMERRLEDILEYLELYPGQTAYSLSQASSLNLNKETARLSLIELEERGDIKLEKELVPERRNIVRKKAYVKPLNEHIWNRFAEVNLDVPEIQALIEKAQKAGYSVIIVREDDSEIEVLPNEDVFEKLAN